MSRPAPRIHVRRTELRDAAAMARIMADPAVYPQLMQLPLANEALWEAKLAGTPSDATADLRLVAEVDGEVVGSLGLHPETQRVRRRHVAQLGISVQPSAWGQGVGSALLHTALDFADRWGQILRIELQVYADNTRAIRLYERFGFRHEGVHHAYALRNGDYVDSLSMARLHPRPPALPK